MKFKTAKRTFDELTERYEKEPKGWKIAVGNDNKGYFDIFISNPEEVWQVKVDSIYKPKPVGLSMKVGGRTEARKIASDKEPSFGFRPISDDIIENIIRRKGEDLSPVLNEILKVEPRRLSDIRSPVVASGPIHYGNKLQISKKQKNLDLELRKNLKKLLFREGIELEYG